MFCEHNVLKNACFDCLRTENARVRKMMKTADLLREYHRTPAGLVGASTLVRLLSGYDKASAAMAKGDG